MKKVLLLYFSLFLSTAFAREINKTQNRETNFSYITAVGFQNVNHINLCILGNGSFHNSSFFNENIPIDSKKLGPILHIYNISLVVGIPAGPWGSHPSVSESISRSPYNISQGDIPDWGLPHEHLEKLLNPTFRISNLYDVITYKYFYLLPTSTILKTWPKNIYGFEYWPGKATIGQGIGHKIPSHFISDQDIYFEMTDKGYADHQIPNVQSGFAMNLMVKGESYAIHDSYARNIVFFDMIMINRSHWKYNDLYIGIFHDFDIYSHQFLKEYPDFILTEPDPNSGKLIHYNLSFMWDRGFFAKHFPKFRKALSCAGVTFLKTPASVPRVGVGQELGITSWHNFKIYYQDSLQNGEFRFVDLLRQPEREKIEYAVLSGDTSGLDSSMIHHLFHRAFTDSTNFHFDDPDYFLTVSDRDMDAMPLPATGPISLAPGDTVHFAFAVVTGTDLEDLKRSTRIAHHMFEHGYRRAGGPPPPYVRAVPGDKRVTLYWDNRSEASADPILGYRNFEGYRIYRTTVDPARNQWEHPRFDDQGHLVGFVPVAQFDKQDGIVGLDTLYPHLNLGSDTRLRYTWTDTTVQNGVTYFYSVTAYDYGVRRNPELNPEGFPRLEARESPRGTDPAEAVNLVEVRPGVPSSNAVFSKAPVQPLATNKGNTLVRARVIDPFRLTGDVYRLTMRKDRLGWYFDLTDESTGEAKLRGIHLVKGQRCPVVDGIQPWVFRFDTLGVLQDSTRWVRADGSPSTCNWKIIGWASYKKAVYDYEIRFKSEPDTGCVYHKTAPFEIWNVTQNRKLQWDILIDSPKDTNNEMRSRWTDGDFIMVKEDLDGLPHFTWWFVLKRHPKPVVTERDTVIRGHHGTLRDTVWVDIPPKAGDILKILTMKPAWAGDSYRIVTRKLGKRGVTSEDLDRIRVVPNPYVVQAAWDGASGGHRIEFTHLPADCEVSIYTMWGGLVRRLEHHSMADGTLFWDLRNEANMDVAYGLYLYVVRTPEGKKKMGKLALIR